MASAMAGSVKVAWLSVAAVLVAAAKFKLRHRKEMPRPEPKSSEMESVAEMKAEDAADPELAQEAGETSELPPPMRRLRYIGASYVVPHARVARCSADFLSFDIPTLPCVWPLRAVLMRPSPQREWAKLQLTVDIIAASGLPPLLTCTRASAMAWPRDCGDCGETGGTGSPSSQGPADAVDEALDSALEDGAAGGNAEAPEDVEDGTGGGIAPWLKVCNAAGTVVATVARRQDGSCIVQRQDRSVWDIAVHLDADMPWITVSKQGQEIGQATSLGRGREGHLQVDTQPDVQSPESAVLLMCMLAVLAFRQ